MEAAPLWAQDKAAERHQQMDMLSLAFYVLVVLVVLAAGWFVMKPEKK
jgi:hypothetical protein